MSYPDILIYALFFFLMLICIIGLLAGGKGERHD
jgi:hypothetical protein